MISQQQYNSLQNIHSSIDTVLDFIPLEEFLQAFVLSENINFEIQIWEIISNVVISFANNTDDIIQRQNIFMFTVELANGETNHNKYNLDKTTALKIMTDFKAKWLDKKITFDNLA